MAKPWSRSSRGTGPNIRVALGNLSSPIITAVHPSENKVTVEGINIVKKHVKPNRQYPQGGIIEITKPIGVSKVGILDPAAKKPSRIGYNIDAKGVKTRIFKTSGKEIK